MHRGRLPFGRGATPGDHLQLRLLGVGQFPCAVSRCTGSAATPKGRFPDRRSCCAVANRSRWPNRLQPRPGVASTRPRQLRVLPGNPAAVGGGEGAGGRLMAYTVLGNCPALADGPWDVLPARDRRYGHWRALNCDTWDGLESAASSPDVVAGSILLSFANGACCHAEECCRSRGCVQNYGFERGDRNGACVL